MKNLFFISCFLLFSICFASPSLQKYLENDLDLKNLALEVKKVENSTKTTSIDNGISVKLSTGDCKFETENDNLNVTFSPSVEATIPQANNFGIGISSSVKMQNGENKTENTKFTLSADIISNNALTRKLKLMKANRDLLEAKRKLKNRALEAEKEFYTELKKLFDSAISIISKQKDLYEDTIQFEEIQAKGYTKNSSKYRQAELKVLSDKHEVDTKIRTLEHDCAVFASKCNDIFEPGTNPRDFLPFEITQVEAVDIHSFEKSAYKKIEEATYNHEYNELERKANKNFRLEANTGYTINNSSAKTQSTANINGEQVDTTSTNSTNTIDLGLSAGISGLSAKSGVSFPVNSSRNPIYTASVTIDPNAFRKRIIENNTNVFSKEEEEIAIQKANDEYITSIVDQTKSLEDINWSKTTNLQTYEMYVQLENDMKKHFEAGIVTESEYLNAFSSKEQYRINLLINDIDLIIYNNTVKLLFIED